MRSGTARRDGRPSETQRTFAVATADAERKIRSVSDPLWNPYAPPAAPPTRVEPPLVRNSSPSNYDGERRSVVILMVLCAVTFGVYPSIWYLRRARFLDSLVPHKKLGPLPWVLLVLIVALLVLRTVWMVSPVGAPEAGAKLLQMGAGLTSLFLAFRVAAILRSDFARSGRPLGISGAGVFFFGCLYLQHILNEAADLPARRARSDPPGSPVIPRQDGTD